MADESANPIVLQLVTRVRQYKVVRRRAVRVRVLGLTNRLLLRLVA